MREENALKYELLFNSEKKKEFIEKYDSIHSKLTLYWQFLKISDFEKKAKKDISEMTIDEIKQIFLNLERKCSSITSATNHINTYKRYIDTVIEDSSNNPFNNIENVFDFAKSVVANELNTRYTREDLMFIIEELNNYTDQALLLCLFEGMKGKGFSEILTLKKESLFHKEVGEDDFYLANVYDEGTKSNRTIEISKDLYDILILADNQTTYRTNNEEEYIETPFNHSEYIFKKAKKGKQTNDVVLDRHFITRKFLFFKEFFGNKNLSADDIIQSGMLHLANSIYEKNGKVTKNDLLIIGDKFNTVMAYSGDSELYRNITHLKRLIFTDSFYDLYNINRNEVNEDTL